MDVLFLLLAVILPDLHRNEKGKIELQKIVHGGIFCKEHHFVDCTPSILCLFVAFFVYSFPLPN